MGSWIRSLGAFCVPLGAWAALSAGDAEPPPPKAGVTVPLDDAAPQPKPKPNLAQRNDPEVARAALPDSDDETPGSATPKPAAPGTPARTAGAPTEPRRNDPEFRPRALLGDDGEAAPPHPAAQHSTHTPRVPQTAPRRDDPERLRTVPLAAEEEPAAEQTTTRPGRPDVRRPSAPSDTPRFPSGMGLDSEQAEQLALLLERERQRALTQDAQVASKQSNSAPDLAADSTEGAAKTGVLDRTLSAVRRREDAARAGQPAAASMPDAALPEGDDPDSRFKRLLADIRKNRETLEAARKKEQELTAANKASSASTEPAKRRTPSDVRTEQAERLLHALNSNTPLVPVSGQVVDGSGKNLLPARVKITDATESALGAPLPTGFYTRGAFEAEALAGGVKVEVSRGRFWPAHLHGFNALPGKKAPPPVVAQLAPPPVLNFARRGWYLADLDLGVAARTGEIPVWFGARPQLDDLLLAAEAENVNIVGWHMSSEESAAALPGLKAGTPLVLPSVHGIRHVFHGQVGALGLTDASNLPRELGDPQMPLRDVLDDLRARGALTVWQNLHGSARVSLKDDLYPLFPGLDKSRYFAAQDTHARLFGAAGLPFETVCGPGFDLFELDGQPESEAVWFNLLNNGYTIPAIGAGGGSLEGGRVPYGQTFVRGGKTLTRESVLEALRAGRSVVSYGPAVFCQIVERQRGSGDTLDADGRQITLQIEAYSSMLPGTQLDRVEVLRNGKVVHSQQATEGEAQIDGLTIPLQESYTSWYVVRVSERRRVGQAVLPGGRAWTNPIYFRGVAQRTPTPVITHLTGRLTRQGTPVSGTLTLVAAGQPDANVALEPDGRFDVHVPAHGALVFAAPGCEPRALRIFEHPRVQAACGALQAERTAPLWEQLAKPSIFAEWRLLLSELEWNVDLEPLAPETPSQLRPTQQP